jgi:hypothetical protein
VIGIAGDSVVRRVAHNLLSLCRSIAPRHSAAIATMKKYNDDDKQARFRQARTHPCSTMFDKVFAAMERSEYDAREAWPYVQELQKCLATNSRQNLQQEKKTAMHYLNSYLDQKKHKRK